MRLGLCLPFVLCVEKMCATASNRFFVDQDAELLNFATYYDNIVVLVDQRMVVYTLLPFVFP
jgi:hypothetical protein